MKPSLSVIIAAYNEESNLESAVNSILSALNGYFSSYEILIYDDGSSDKTSEIADRLAATHPAIKAVHNGRNRGLGYSIQNGFELASKEYVTWCAGDNPMFQESLTEMFRNTGKADVVTSYVANPEFRAPYRRWLSQSYVMILNCLFGLKMRYYNGFAIYKSELVKKIRTSTQGFSFLAEILVLLVKSGHSYLEVPTHHRVRAHGQSKAFSIRNIRDILKTLLHLMGVVYFRQGPRKSALR